MESCTDDCLEMKTALTNLEYPGIECMCDEEIADIFLPSNRCFLVCWSLRLLDISISEEDKNEERLGQYLQDYGFCLEHEKESFMNNTLDIKEQLKVFQRIFYLINEVKKPTKVAPVLLTLEDLQNNLKADNLNLFPHLGPIKVLADEETNVKTQHLNTVDENLYSNSNYMKVDNDTSLEMLKKLERNLKCLQDSKTLENKKEVTSLEIGENNNGRILKECAKNLQKNSQYLEDLRIIKNFQKNPPVLEPEKDMPNLENLKMICKAMYEVRKAQNDL